MNRKKHSPRRSRRLRTFMVATAATLATGVPLLAGATYFNQASGAVFTLSNAPAGNRVLVFDRRADGRLSRRRAFSTGGNGTGGGLGNQGALALSKSGNWLLAVNPGSDSISVFLVFGSYLLRTDVESSRGMLPVSVTIEDDLVYVLNAGSDDVQGYRLTIFGDLVPLRDSKRNLSADGVGAAQVSFNRAGDLLAVTEKATNRVLTFAVDGDGRLGQRHVQDSPAPTPFGFDFGRRDQMLVSEAAGGAAGASTLSTWQLAGDGSGTPISAAVPSGQSAACWVEVTRDGRHAFVTNTASDNLSTYVVSAEGVTTLAEAVAAEVPAGGGPTDVALDRHDRHLYTLNPGTGSISAFRVDGNGGLQLIEHQAAVGAGSGATGLVAR